MNGRPSLHLVMLEVAKALASRAACLKRQVGCVLVDKQGRIIGTGYNGRPRGLPNCRGGYACTAHCEGVHAEINALLQCKGDDVHAAYVTHAPCWHCVKALVNTGCQSIWYLDGETYEAKAHQLWYDLNRSWWHALSGGIAESPKPPRAAPTHTELKD